MKYIVVAITDHTGKEDSVREVPVIFPDMLVHKDMAELTIRSLRRLKPDGRAWEVEPVSAGFLSSMAFDAKADFCHGESESLGLKSRGKLDSKLILSYDYFHGIPT